MGSETIVTAGVDTHTDVHVPAVLDQAGRLLGTKAFPATTSGYAQLATWTETFGRVDKIGMEGTGSFGAGLLCFLTGYGLTVVKVDRPDPQTGAATASLTRSTPSPPPAPSSPAAPPGYPRPGMRRWRRSGCCAWPAGAR